MSADTQSAKAPPSGSGSIRDGTYVVQSLRTISAEEIKRLIKLLERADEEYTSQAEDEGATVEPPILRETYPFIAPKDELNTAGVFQACMYLFRDA